MKKLGLALGGGGARGCAHVGVIRALQEAEIPIHCVAGTSMGALVGGVFAAGHLDDLEAYLEKIRWSDVLTQMDPTMMSNGLLKGGKLKKLLEKMVQEKVIEACQIPFAAMATSLNDGTAVVLKKGSLPEAIRASVSLPGILVPVQQGEDHLIDGGVVNPLPIDEARKMGAELVLAIDLSREYVYEQHERGKDEKEEGMKKWLSADYPSLLDVMEGALFLMQRGVMEKNLIDDPADVMMHLKLSSARLFDFHKAKKLIKEGYEAMQKEILNLKKLLD